MFFIHSAALNQYERQLNDILQKYISPFYSSIGIGNLLYTNLR